MIRREETYSIGRVGKPHGVRGEVTLRLTDDVFDRVEADYLLLDVDGILVPFFIEEYRFRSEETALMKFEDVDTQEQAAELTGCEICFPRSLSDDEGGMPSWSALVGWTVVSAADGAAVGEIVAVDDSTINTLFETLTADGRTLLLPATGELITGVDETRREIRLQLPEGILSL